LLLITPKVATTPTACCYQENHPMQNGEHEKIKYYEKQNGY
jgi:hypothetical protein